METTMETSNLHITFGSATDIGGGIENQDNSFIYQNKEKLRFHRHYQEPHWAVSSGRESSHSAKPLILFFFTIS
jgi:hypothetical protein